MLKKLALCIPLVISPFAQAEGVFSIGKFTNGLEKTCNGIEYRGYLLSPRHCIEHGSNSQFIYMASNPIKGYPIESFIQPRKNLDLAIIHSNLKPPKGEDSSGFLCSLSSQPGPIILHSCTSTKGGDSGSLIRSNNKRLMHLGLIEINGERIGFGVDYRSIINNYHQ